MERQHTHHVEVVVDSHCPALEALEHFEGVLVVLVGDARVGELRVECFLGWELRLIQLLSAIHVLIWINTLSQKQPHILCLKPMELLSELNEPLESRLLEVLGECGQA